MNTPTRLNHLPVKSPARPAQQPAPRPAAETLALLERIAAATEANTRALAGLLEEIQHLSEMSNTTADASSNTANTLDRVAAALAGLAASLAPSQPAAVPAVPAPAAPAPAGLIDFTADTLLLSYDDKGSPVVKLKGHPYSKFGVRVWPEAWQQLEINLQDLAPGQHPYGPHSVRAALGENGAARKVISFTPTP